MLVSFSFLFRFLFYEYFILLYISFENIEKKTKIKQLLSEIILKF